MIVITAAACAAGHSCDELKRLRNYQASATMAGSTCCLWVVSCLSIGSCHLQRIDKAVMWLIQEILDLKCTYMHACLGCQHGNSYICIDCTGLQSYDCMTTGLCYSHLLGGCVVSVLY